MEKQKIPNIFTQYLEKIKNHFHHPSQIKISQRAKIELFDNLFNLISSGIPITNAVSILLFQTKDKKVKMILESITKDIHKGKPLQETLKAYQNSFSTFDVYMIKMGEITGKLADSLEIIKNREEKNADLKSKVIGALIYPIIIVGLSISMIIGFMTFVIPKVQKMYVDAKVNLPTLTQHVIDTSEFLTHNWLFLVLTLLCCIYIGSKLNRSAKTKVYVDQYILEIPIFGNLIRKKILTIFTHTLGTLIQNGIIINEALEIAKKSLENTYYEKRMDEILEHINEGIPLSDLMGISKLKAGEEDPFFPIELASVVKIGEQTGKLPSLLLKVSQKFQKEIDVLVKNLSTMIEPIVIIGVGIIVGTMVMAILLPFFNMVNVM